MHLLIVMDLMASVFDLFSAGSETTSSTLRWVVLYMAVHPDVQLKIQKEIDGAVPKERMPSLEDRNNLPYLEAMLLEVQRKVSLTPIGLGHNVTKDVEIGGYILPKDTIIFGHAEGIHNDPTYWEKPNEFYPEHFLDQNGKVISKKDGFLPFSIGRRVCPGESLAKMELFLFTSSFLQKFSISVPPGEVLTTETDKSRSLFNFAKPYKVIFNQRK